MGHLPIQLQSHLWREQEKGEKTRMNSCLFCQLKIPAVKGLASYFRSNGIECQKWDILTYAHSKPDLVTPSLHSTGVLLWSKFPQKMGPVLSESMKSLGKAWVVGCKSPFEICAWRDNHSAAFDPGHVHHWGFPNGKALLTKVQETQVA